MNYLITCIQSRQFRFRRGGLDLISIFHFTKSKSVFKQLVQNLIQTPASLSVLLRFFWPSRLLARTYMYVGLRADVPMRDAFE